MQDADNGMENTATDAKETAGPLRSVTLGAALRSLDRQRVESLARRIAQDERNLRELMERLGTEDSIES